MFDVKLLILTSISAACIFSSEARSAAMTSENYRIEPTTFSSSGGISTSANYSISFTLGQSTAIGESTSASYELLAGFWYQLQELIVKGDIDGDEDVDLYDVILGLKVLSGEAINGITTDGDINDDSKIGMEEVLFDLNKTSQ